MLDAIYHPSYVPDKDWYKTQLLIWDNIYRIVPHSVNASFGSSKIADQWEIEENLVQTKDIMMPSHQYFDSREKIITNQFKMLSKIKSHFFTAEDYFYLNTAKVPDWIGDKLNIYKLRKEKVIDEWGSKHYLVRSDVSDFIMSCIAHNFSLEQGLSPLTDRKASCFATYGNQIGDISNRQPVGENLSTFLTGVFNIMVPSNVQMLSFRDIMQIRDEYKDLREAVSNILVTISNEFRLDQIIDKRRAQDLIIQSIENFNHKIDVFNKQRWRRTISDWRTQSLATFLGALAGFLAGGPGIALIVSMTGASVQIMNQVSQKNSTDYIKSSVQYFSKINRRIKLNKIIEEANNYYSKISSFNNIPY
jgi:hypothetical protein